ncbi:MAG: hypothetical protein GF353_02985 [Candidatus Lokiarchaeota archaeon]|nr:hypothetical protein [Candidatus Lokiarchaeota archaeon]
MKRIIFIIMFISLLINLNCYKYIPIQKSSSTYLKHNGLIKKVGVAIFDNAYLNKSGYVIDKKRGKLFVTNQIKSAGRLTQEALIKYLSGQKTYYNFNPYNNTRTSNYNKETKEIIKDYTVVPVNEVINESQIDNDFLNRIKQEYDIDGLIIGIVGMTVETKRIVKREEDKNGNYVKKALGKYAMIGNCQLSLAFYNLLDGTILYDYSDNFELSDRKLKDSFWDKLSDLSELENSNEINIYELSWTVEYNKYKSKEENLNKISKERIYASVESLIPGLGRYISYIKE